MDFSAVIVAAGGGIRLGGGTAKQWRSLGGKPVLRWSAEALERAGARQIVVVIRAEDAPLAEQAMAGLSDWRWVAGGETRDASVRSGLDALEPVDTVLVHDAARPFLSPKVIERLLEALEGAEGAVPALPVPDTLKRQDGGAVTTVAREGLWRAQTPQAFHLAALRDAYAALAPGAAPTDDAAVVEAAGGRVLLVTGDPMLFKLTWPEDFDMAQAIANHQAGSVRTGTGFDAHRLGPGDHVWLCGVKVAHDQGLIGHSDADVGLHALTDAVLGAAGLGDIGQHFPPSDPQWKGASSDRFLRHAGDLVAGLGGRIENLDVTLICEAPKVGPHRQAMREAIAAILALDIAQVSVKATTTEGMGFTGRREGIAAQAVATIRL